MFLWIAALPNLHSHQDQQKIRNIKVGKPWKLQLEIPFNLHIIPQTSGVPFSSLVQTVVPLEAFPQQIWFQHHALQNTFTDSAWVEASAKPADTSYVILALLTINCICIWKKLNSFQKIFVVLQVAVLHEMKLRFHSPSVEGVVEATASQQCVPLDEPRKFSVHSHRTGPLQMKSMLVEHSKVTNCSATRFAHKLQSWKVPRSHRRQLESSALNWNEAQEMHGVATFAVHPRVGRPAGIHEQRPAEGS